MKKIAFILVCLISMLSPLAIQARDDYQIPESVPANNGELDWLIYKDHNGEAKIGKKEVTLKSLKKSRWGLNYPCVTYAKVPINMNGDFYMSVTLKPSKVDIDHPIGFVFNNATSNQHHIIFFDGQFCSYPINERVTYKKVKSKNDTWKISIEKKNGSDYIISLNGLEVGTMPKNLVFNSPCVGVYSVNKGEVKILEVSYEQWAAPSENYE